MKDERLYLIHILECIQRIEAYTSGGRDQFMQDTRTQDAVIRNFEIIGEAARRISQPTRDLAPEFPWRRVARFRDVLIHQYEGVNLAGVWQVIARDLPGLKHELTALFGVLGRQGTQGADPSALDP